MYGRGHMFESYDRSGRGDPGYGASQYDFMSGLSTGDWRDACRHRFGLASHRPHEHEMPRLERFEPVDSVQAPPEKIKWEGDVVSAYEKARDSKKPLVVVFETDWCNYCKLLKKDTLDSPEAAKMGGRAVFVKVDPEKDEQAASLVKQLNVTGYPTVVVLDALPDKLNEKGRVVGYLKPDKFVPQLAKHLPEINQAPDKDPLDQPATAVASAIVDPAKNRCADTGIAGRQVADSGGVYSLSSSQSYADRIIDYFTP